MSRALGDHLARAIFLLAVAQVAAIQVLLRDAGLVSCRVLLARAGTHSRLDSGALRRRHVCHRLLRYLHPRDQGLGRYLPGARLDIQGFCLGRERQCGQDQGGEYDLHGGLRAPVKTGKVL